MHALWAVGSLLIITFGVCVMSFVGPPPAATNLAGVLIVGALLCIVGGAISLICSISHDFEVNGSN